MHHVTLYEAKTGVVLKEQMVAEKEGELTQVKAFLTPLLLQGGIIGADALYTQKHVCHQVIASRGDSLLFAKGNQPADAGKICVFSLANPLLIAWIGGRTPRWRKGMVVSPLTTHHSPLAYSPHRGLHPTQ